jgi:hypothetical protein
VYVNRPPPRIPRIILRILVPAAQSELLFTYNAVGATAKTPPPGYVVDETGLTSKFRFAYGTLSGHVESGEERFLVKWGRGDDAGWYDILAFSRANHFLPQLGHPVVCCLQKRFGQDSGRPC